MNKVWDDLVADEGGSLEALCSLDNKTTAVIFSFYRSSGFFCVFKPRCRDSEITRNLSGWTTY